MNRRHGMDRDFRDTGKRVLHLADDRDVILERTKDGMRIISGEGETLDLMDIVFEWLWLQGQRID